MSILSIPKIFHFIRLLSNLLSALRKVSSTEIRTRCCWQSSFLLILVLWCFIMLFRTIEMISNTCFRRVVLRSTFDFADGINNTQYDSMKRTDTTEAFYNVSYHCCYTVSLNSNCYFTPISSFGIIWRTVLM